MFVVPSNSSKYTSTDIKATKLIFAKRKGIAKLTFVCKFSMRNEGNATWHLNGFNTEGYPHFQVTTKYEHHVLTTTLKVVSSLYLLQTKFL